MAQGSQKAEILLTLIEGELRVTLRRREQDGGQEDLTLFAIRTATLRDASPREASFIIGSRMLAALAHIDERTLGHLGYKALVEEANAIGERALLKRAADADPEALYELAFDKMFEATTIRSLRHLDIAEEYLKKASELGLRRATDFLTRVWPMEKEARRRLIQDNGPETSQ